MTISISDLRPGNLVAVKGCPTPLRVQSVSLPSGLVGFQQLVKKRKRLVLQSIEDVQPIQLAPTSLTACGMFFHDGRRYWQFHDIRGASWWPVWKRKECYYVFPFGENHGSLQVCSLHQLQNLYFFHTGQELDINVDLLAKQLS